jgi:hypothetical protein
VEDLWIDLKKMNVGAIFEKRQDTTSVLDNEKWAYLTGSISRFKIFPTVHFIYCVIVTYYEMIQLI